jgi:hypothetical protein
MFQKPTVFVIGAGSSAELALPVGSGLMENMFETFSQPASDKCRAMVGAFLRSGVPGANINVELRMRNFAAGLSAAPSIDQYLHFHRDDPALVMLGKCSIATEILYAEAGSTLNEGTVDGPLPDCWLRVLFHLLVPGIERANLDQLFQNVSFVSFNYDRTIRLFMLRAIQGLTHCTYQEALAIAEKIRVWHPYGSVGGIGWGEPGIAQPVIGFSARNLDETDILKAAKGIRTFTEGMSDEASDGHIREALTEATQIVFLGFSYIDQNMELLKIRHPGNSAMAYGTTHGMSAPDEELAGLAIRRAFKGDNYQQRGEYLQLSNHKAKGLLQTWGKVLRS